MSGSPAPTRMVGKLVDLISGAPFNSEGTFVKCLAPAVPPRQRMADVEADVLLLGEALLVVIKRQDMQDHPCDRCETASRGSIRSR